MPARLSHRPPGYSCVTAYLLVKDPERLVRFLKDAFDAVEIETATDERGRIMHAAYRIEDSIVELGRAHDEWTPRAAGLHVYMAGVDAVHERAVKAGGTSLQEPTDQIYGERASAVRDPTGNEWYLATYTGR